MLKGGAEFSECITWDLPSYFLLCSCSSGCSLHPIFYPLSDNGQKNSTAREAPRSNNNKQSETLRARQRAYGQRSPPSKQSEILRARQRAYGRRSPPSKQSETLKTRQKTYSRKSPLSKQSETLRARQRTYSRRSPPSFSIDPPFPSITRNPVEMVELPD